MDKDSMCFQTKDDGRQTWFWFSPLLDPFDWLNWTIAMPMVSAIMEVHCKLLCFLLSINTEKTAVVTIFMLLSTCKLINWQKSIKWVTKTRVEEMFIEEIPGRLQLANCLSLCTVNCFAPHKDPKAQIIWEIPFCRQRTLHAANLWNVVRQSYSPNQSRE